jgi:hypothetical protein
VSIAWQRLGRHAFHMDIGSAIVAAKEHAIKVTAIRRIVRLPAMQSARS